jgi:two-component system sensor histidine kinase QseC
MMSIRTRLLASLLVLWTVIWGAIGLVALERSNHEVEELLDAELAQMAHLLSKVCQISDLAAWGVQGQTLASIGHPYETKISFQLWHGDELLASLGAAPPERLAQQLGFSDQTFGVTRWRVFGLACEDQERALYAAQDYSVRQELVSYLTVNALQPILWSLPLAALLIWLAINDGLRPLSRLAREVAWRSDRRLDPIADDEVPAEVRPLIRSVNALMQQLRRALSAEQRFADDASHELRTPVAIIRTHAQIAQRARDKAELQLALSNVDRGAERATRVVEQLLALSRVRYDSEEQTSDSASLTLALTEIAADRRPIAEAQDLRLEERLPADDVCAVGMPAAMLRVLVANLIDNAIKFTPAGGSIAAEIDPRDETLQLTVSDTGPGIAPERRERAFDRFYRDPDQEQPGAGLGLSIVKRICDLYGAEIRLEDAAPAGGSGDGPGLRVTVLFARSTHLDT